METSTKNMPETSTGDANIVMAAKTFFSLPEATMLIAEHLDLPSLLKLSQTNQTARNALNTYEHSVVKAKLKMLQGSLSLPPSGAVLSSLRTERYALEPYSYSAFNEITTRARRIKVMLLKGETLRQVIADDNSFCDLPKEEEAKLIAGLGRALMLTDRLADCLAHVQTRAQQSSPRAHRDDGTDGDEDGKENREGERERMMRQSHIEQLQFLLYSVQHRDLAFLATLCDLASMAYARVHPWSGANPDPWPRIYAFQEALLRHGSAVLWAWLWPHGFTENGYSLSEFSPAHPAPINRLTSSRSSSSGTNSHNGGHNVPFASGLGSSAEGMPGADSATTITSQAANSHDFSSGLPATKPLNAKERNRFANAIEEIVDDILWEIDNWETGPRASEESEFADETLTLPGLRGTLTKAYCNAVGIKDRKRAAWKMEREVLWAIRHASGGVHG